MTVPATEFLAFLKATAESASPPRSLEEFRGQFDGLTAEMQAPEGVESSAVNMAGVEVLHQRSGQASAATTVIYCHGGGYVLGSTQTHASLTGHLALATGGDVYSVNYRLAPEHPWPAAIEDVCAVYQSLLDGDTSPKSIFLAGDSAGGGLVLASMLAARQQGLPMPAGLVLLSPWCDLSNSGWSNTAQAERDFVCSAPILSTCAAYYTGGIEPEDGAKSALFADLAGLPPMLIHAGSEEMLLSDATRLAARAGASRVPVDLKVWPLMPHAFQLFLDHLEEARASVRDIGDWINAF